MSRYALTCFLAGAATAWLCLTTRAQDAPPATTQPAQTSQQQPAQPSDQSTDTEQTKTEDAVQTPRNVPVEDILKEFEKERPKARPVLPSQTGDESTGELVTKTDDVRSHSQLRLPDGYFLVDRTGRLRKEGDWWVFVFVSDNNPDQSPDPPMKLLPNRMLERMVRETQNGTVDADFIVSGEVTDFLGENYLLLRKLMRKRNQGNLSK